MVSLNIETDDFRVLILEGSKMPINYQTGESIHIVFKETEVSLARNFSGQISFHNRFNGTIRAIDKSNILTKVLLDYKGNLLESIISTESAEKLDLQINETIEWLVKSNEISLMKINL